MSAWFRRSAVWSSRLLERTLRAVTIPGHSRTQSDRMSLGAVMDAAPVRRWVHMLTYIVTAQSFAMESR